MPQSGTSLAAPHVTGTVALLQEYAEDRIKANAAGWNADARRHEVMKAVLLNSADKLGNARDTDEKEILKENGTNWTKSVAADDPANKGGREIPLDPEMGAGQLNAKRALEQFKTGEQKPPAGGGTVPVIGWDYNELAMNGGSVRYRLPKLKGGSYVAITVAWDRVVDFSQDGGVMGVYDRGDQFAASALADLDLYLYERGKNTNSLWSSISSVDNVEHIFFKLPQDGEYDFEVYQHGALGSKFAVAWWATVADAPEEQPPPGGVSGRVWLDDQVDGIRQSAEAGEEDVRVDLYDLSGNWVRTTTTDVNGLYTFQGVAAGDYHVRVENPVGFGFTLANVGNDDTVDSDVDATGQTGIITVGSGMVSSLDAGFVPVTPGAVGGLLWLDRDQDGTRDTDDPGVAGAAIYLFDGADHLIDATTTDSTGAYHFDSVQPGQYYLGFEQPWDYSGFTLRDQGSDALDSDADSTGQTSLFSVAAGQVNQTFDAGLTSVIDPLGVVGSVGNFAWEDSDGDGIQDTGEAGLAGVPVTLVGADGRFIDTTVTDTAGAYSFSQVSPGSYFLIFGKPAGQESAFAFSPRDQGSDTVDSDAGTDGLTQVFTLAPGETKNTVDVGLVRLPPATVGDRVWNDTNGNGLQDAGEPGVAGVAVSLFRLDGTLVGSTTTNSSGQYQFASVVPGDYYLVFTAPSSAVFSPPVQGTDPTIDSDTDTTGTTDVFTLGGGQTRSDLDAGLVFASIGDRVWYDANHNGVQDTGESGIAGVQVSLFTSAGNFVASTTTNSAGIYTFFGVAPGDYYLVFSRPSQMAFTLQDQGSDSTDSDANANGITAFFTLLAGQQTALFDAGLVWQ